MVANWNESEQCRLILTKVRVILSICQPKKLYYVFIIFLRKTATCEFQNSVSGIIIRTIMNF